VLEFCLQNNISNSVLSNEMAACVQGEAGEKEVKYLLRNV
jgi:hypothetical protein